MLREHSIRPSSSTPPARLPAPPIRGLVTLPPPGPPPPPPSLLPRSPVPVLLPRAAREARRRAQRMANPVHRRGSSPRWFWRDFRRMRANVVKCSLVLSLSLALFLSPFHRRASERASELANGISRGLSLHNDLSIALIPCRITESLTPFLESFQHVRNFG